jgi:hypothetical protein
MVMIVNTTIKQKYTQRHFQMSSGVFPLYCCADGHNHKILYTQQDTIYKV